MSITQTNKNDDNMFNLYELSRIRRQNSYIKSMNPQLVKRELVNHQRTIREYRIDLSNHLFYLEKLSDFRKNNPNLSCFKSQPYINSEMRYLIFEFLMCCHSRLSLTTSTLFQTFNLVDRYTSKFILKNTNYQLVALTCLWISSKFFDAKKNIPNLRILENLCCSQYCADQFIATEFQILKSLNWSITSSPTPDSFIDMILFKKTLNPNSNDKNLNINEIKVLSIMICELSEFKPDLSFNISSSKLSKISTEIALLIEAFSKNNRQWFKFSKDEYFFLSILLDDNEIIPASFKLKYDDIKLSKIISFIKRFKEEKLMNDHITSIIESSEVSRNNSFCESNSPESVNNNGRSTSATPKLNLKKMSIVQRDVIMPLTPTTPIYFKKRYQDEVDDSQTNNAKRVCK